MGIIHETIANYAQKSNGVAKRKNRTLQEMVNTMIFYFGLSERFQGEAILTACHILNRVPTKTNKETSFDLWYPKKKKPNSSYFKVWGCRAIVRVPKNNRQKLDERGQKCIFIGYAQHNKTYRFYIIEQNDYLSIYSIIESSNAIFDDNRFSSLSIKKNLQISTEANVDNDQQEPLRDVDTNQQLDDGEENVEIIPIRSKRQLKVKNFGPDFHVYLVDETRDKVASSVPYIFI